MQPGKLKESKGDHHSRRGASQWLSGAEWQGPRSTMHLPQMRVNKARAPHFTTSAQAVTISGLSGPLQTSDHNGWATTKVQKAGDEAGFC